MPQAIFILNRIRIRQSTYHRLINTPNPTLELYPISTYFHNYNKFQRLISEEA
jgi:hypothetical protein